MLADFLLTIYLSLVFYRHNLLSIFTNCIYQKHHIIILQKRWVLAAETAAAAGPASVASTGWTRQMP